MSYTNGLDDPSAHFQIKTGVGASQPQSHTFDGNSDLQPDFLWWKRRDSSSNHWLHDSSRGANKFLYANGTNGEGTDANQITSFNTNGFSTGSSWFDLGSQTWVAWAWKANGGTTSTDTNGSITSTVQVNQDAGFSIVQYTGTGSTADQTIGHGLGVRANAVIVKNRNGAANWVVWSEGVDANHSLELNTTDSISDSTQGRVLSNAPTRGTSTIFSIRSGSGSVIQTNTSGEDYIAYCFAEKQGYSKFGKYVGNGNTNGAFVYTGFKPAWVMIKRSDGVTNWRLFDNKRSGFNGDTSQLYPNLSNAEDAAGDQIDLLSNGFKNRTVSGDQNISGASYIYMAFAENPFTTSTGIPTTAR